MACYAEDHFHAVSESGRHARGRNRRWFERALPVDVILSKTLVMLGVAWPCSGPKIPRPFWQKLTRDDMSGEAFQISRHQK